VVREPDPPAAAAADKGAAERDAQPLLVSAHSAAALADLARGYVDLLRSPDAPPLAAVCRTAAVRRTHHRHRLAVFGANSDELADRLAAFAAGEKAPLLVEGEARATPARLAFLFSGNGAQWHGMGRDLLADPFCAGWIARVDKTLRPRTGWSVAAMLENKDPNLYDRTEIAQPALFAVQVAVVEWLRAHGIDAGVMVGHSVGEVAAAYAAGILSLDQACRVVAERSGAQARTAGTGRMAALGLSAEDAAVAISPYGARLTIAAINSPNSVTIAGDAEALDELGAELEPNRIFFRQLDLDYAFHSRLMDPIRKVLLDQLDGLAPGEGRARFVSTVTGATLDGPRLDAGYWWDNIRRPSPRWPPRGSTRSSRSGRIRSSKAMFASA
jgi:acyl transferase domain-containing protein